jgi:hypothetical protein
MGLKKSSRPIAYPFRGAPENQGGIYPANVAGDCGKERWKVQLFPRDGNVPDDALVLKPDETVIHCKFVARMKRAGRL